MVSAIPSDLWFFFRVWVVVIATAVIVLAWQLHWQKKEESQKIRLVGKLKTNACAIPVQYRQIARAVHVKSGDSHTCTVMYTCFVRDKIVRRIAAKDSYLHLHRRAANDGYARQQRCCDSRQPGIGITRLVLVTPLTQSTPADTIIQQLVFATTRSSLNSQPSLSASLTQQQHTVSKEDIHPS